MSTETRIVHQKPNGAPEKRDRPFATSWYAPVLYTLEDGSTVSMNYGPCTRKKDAVERAAERSVGNMWAYFEDGEFAGVRERYGI